MASVQHVTGKSGAWVNPLCDKYKLRPMVDLYIALQDLDFSFLPNEVSTVITLWKEGMSVYDIADRLNRPAEEIGVLLIDLSMRKKVFAREYGLMGKENGGQ